MYALLTTIKNDFRDKTQRVGEKRYVDMLPALQNVGKHDLVHERQVVAAAREILDHN